VGKQYFGVAEPQIYGGSNNIGDAALNVGLDYGKLTTSDYRLTYDGSNYVLTRLPQNSSQSYATLPISVPDEGLAISVTSGVMSPGDSFLIQPTRNGANALALLILDTNAI